MNRWHWAGSPTEKDSSWSPTDWVLLEELGVMREVSLWAYICLLQSNRIFSSVSSSRIAFSLRPLIKQGRCSIKSALSNVPHMQTKAESDPSRTSTPHNIQWNTINKYNVRVIWWKFCGGVHSKNFDLSKYPWDFIIISKFCSGVHSENFLVPLTWGLKNTNTKHNLWVNLAEILRRCPQREFRPV